MDNRLRPPYDEITLDRFLSKIAFSDEGCWEWTSTKDSKGYGVFWHEGSSVKAHRLAFCLFNSVDISSLGRFDFACHTCDTPSCVRSDHVYIGTPRDNANDRSQRGRSNSARGTRHGSFTHPESIASGWRSGPRKAKGRAERAAAMLSDWESGEYTQAGLARKYEVDPSTVNRLVSGESWR